MSEAMRISSIIIKGFRPFKDFNASLGPLEVLVGSNGSGKTALFEFLRFLRDGMRDDIPPEIIPGSVGQQLFHLSGAEKFSWYVLVGAGAETYDYQGTIIGPVGRPRVSGERIIDSAGVPILTPRLSPVDGSEDGIILRESEGDQRQLIKPVPANRLVLSWATDPSLKALSSLREYIRRWRFFNASAINSQKMRRSVLVEQEPSLSEDCGNLSAVLHYLYTEHREAFDQLQQLLRSTVPGFKGLLVRARGAPGEVIAFWQEANIDSELTLADLSDGTLRLLCWAALCYQPNLPTLICIDEPEVGVHPRALPVLAGLFKKTAARTQVVLATHSSYFLTQFELNQIAVMRKRDGSAEFIKPADSKTLTNILEDFGAAEIEILHKSDELETLP